MAGSTTPPLTLNWWSGREWMDEWTVREQLATWCCLNGFAESLKLQQWVLVKMKVFLPTVAMCCSQGVVWFLGFSLYILGSSLYNIKHLKSAIVVIWCYVSNTEIIWINIGSRVHPWKLGKIYRFSCSADAKWVISPVLWRETEYWKTFFNTFLSREIQVMFLTSCHLLNLFTFFAVLYRNLYIFQLSQILVNPKANP